MKLKFSNLKRLFLLTRRFCYVRISNIQNHTTQQVRQHAHFHITLSISHVFLAEIIVRRRFFFFFRQHRACSAAFANWCVRVHVILRVRVWTGACRWRGRCDCFTHVPPYTMAINGINKWMLKCHYETLIMGINRITYYLRPR